MTEAHRAEEQQTLLMQEMAHRVKNTLALVQAVAAQTLRSAPDLDAAMEAFNGRLMALSDAHDVLIRGAWAEADLAAVIAGVMAPHIDAVAGRFTAAAADAADTLARAEVLGFPPLIAEAALLLRQGLALEPGSVADAFAAWNEGELESFLLERRPN